MAASATFPCATAQPVWLLNQAIGHYDQSLAHYKTVSYREKHRRKFFALAKQVIPIIGGTEFIKEFTAHCAPGDNERAAVAAELVRELASGK